MKLTEGKVFDMAKPDEVTSYLKNLKRHKITVSPDKLFIFGENEKLFVAVNGVGKIVLPLRKAFVYKLLRWFHFPMRQLSLLNTETVVSILNDYLLSIKSPVVHVKIENGEALTITSDNYTEIGDLYLLETFRDYGITAVTRNDFMMRVYYNGKVKEEIFAGDMYNFGVNIVNSETGFRALSVYHYVLRLVCSNGLIARTLKSESRIHYGFKPDELKEFVKDRIDKSYESKSKVVNAIKKSARRQASSVNKDFTGRISSIVGKENAREIFEGINDNSSLYELTNRVTNFAQRLEVGKRFALEELAGKMIMN